MRASILTFILLFFGYQSVIPLHAAAPSADKLEQTRRLYEQAENSGNIKDFEKAAEALAALLSNDYINGAIYYNLGNAWYRANAMGKAIAAYRQAKRLLPRQTEIEANLRTARSKAPGTLPEFTSPWWKRVLFWHDALNQTERLNSMSSCFVLVFILGIAHLFILNEKLRRILRRSGYVMTILGFCFALSVCLGYQIETITQYGVVIVPEVQARTGNGTSFAYAFNKSLREGSEFVVLEKRGDWYKVELPSFGDAWLPAESVTIY